MLKSIEFGSDLQLFYEKFANVHFFLYICMLFVCIRVCVRKIYVRTSENIIYEVI